MHAGDLRAEVAELMPQAKADLSELVAFRSVADPGPEPPESAARRRTGSCGSSPRPDCGT